MTYTVHFARVGPKGVRTDGAPGHLTAAQLPVFLEACPDNAIGYGPGLSGHYEIEITPEDGGEPLRISSFTNPDNHL